MRILIWAPGFWPLPSPSLWPRSWKKWFLLKIVLFSDVKYSHFFLPWWHWHIGLFCLFTRLVSGVTSILLNKRHQMKRKPYCMIHVRNIQKMGKTDARVSAFRTVTSLGKKRAEVSGVAGGTQVGPWQCSASRWWLHGSIYFEIKSWYYYYIDDFLPFTVWVRLHWKKTLKGGKKQWTYYMLDWQKDLTVSTIWDYVKQPKCFTFLLTV